MPWKLIEKMYFDKETGYLELIDHEGNKYYGKLTDITDDEREIKN